MSINSRDPNSVRIITTLLLILLVSLLTLGIFNIVSFTSMQTNSSSVQITSNRILITKVSVLNSASNETFLSVTVKNTGNTEVSLRGSSPSTSSLVFYPDSIEPGQYSNGLAEVQKVLNFEGRNGSAIVKNSPSLNVTSFGIEFYFAFNGFVPDEQQVFGKGAGTSPSYFVFYTFGAVNNINDFLISNNSTRLDAQLGNIVLPRTWYDVFYIDNGSAISAFVNGELVKSWQADVSYIGNMNDLWIGECGCGGHSFNGSLAFIRFYSRQVNSDVVTYNYYHPENPIAEGLSMWLQFNETTGNTISDLSNHNNGAAIFGNTQLVTPTNMVAPFTVTAFTSSGSQFNISSTFQL
jgi:hypothetical protein